MTSPPLLTDVALESSAVVANNAMNRERGLTGVNSYARDLGFDPLAHLYTGASWLDLCCGSGRALVQTARHRPDLTLTGVDLVGHFDDHEPTPGFSLVTASVATWRPERHFDLITCVHGLHYLGDKLTAISRALSWLSPTGLLAAHLDLANVKLDGKSAIPALRRLFRDHGIDYHPRRKLLTRRGATSLPIPYHYLGADDRAGPNFTNQPAVDSHYTRLPLV